MCNPTAELRDVSEMQHYNLPGAVVLLLEKGFRGGVSIKK